MVEGKQAIERSQRRLTDCEFDRATLTTPDKVAQLPGRLLAIAGAPVEEKANRAVESLPIESGHCRPCLTFVTDRRCRRRTSGDPEPSCEKCGRSKMKSVLPVCMLKCSTLGEALPALFCLSACLALGSAFSLSFSVRFSQTFAQRPNIRSRNSSSSSENGRLCLCKNCCHYCKEGNVKAMEMDGRFAGSVHGDSTVPAAPALAPNSRQTLRVVQWW